MELTTEQRDAVAAACVMAAFADGANSEREREHVRKAMEGLGAVGVDLSALTRGVLTKQIDVGDVARELAATPAGRALAYEMAVAVCDADGVSTPREKEFLAALHKALGLATAEADAAVNTADQIVSFGIQESGPPALVAPAGATPTVDHKQIDDTIVNHSILAAAFELLPQSLATTAIIPLQMKMVYGIGKRHGYSLDSGHIKDFLATVGVGATSQVLESFTRRLLGGVAGKLGGMIGVGGLARTAVNWGTGPAFTFASTYALGKVAAAYYANGRRLTGVELQSLFAKESQAAKGVFEQYAPQIHQRASGLNVGGVMSALRGG